VLSLRVRQIIQRQNIHNVSQSNLMPLTRQKVKLERFQHTESTNTQTTDPYMKPFSMSDVTEPLKNTKRNALWVIIGITSITVNILSSNKSRDALRLAGKSIEENQVEEVMSREDQMLMLEVCDTMLRARTVSPELLRENHILDYLLKYCTQSPFAVSALAVMAGMPEFRDEVMERVPWDKLCADNSMENAINNPYAVPQLLYSLSKYDDAGDYINHSVSQYIAYMITSGAPSLQTKAAKILNNLCDNPRTIEKVVDFVSLLDQFVIGDPSKGHAGMEAIAKIVEHRNSSSNPDFLRKLDHFMKEAGFNEENLSLTPMVVRNAELRKRKENEDHFWVIPIQAAFFAQFWGTLRWSIRAYRQNIRGFRNILQVLYRRVPLTVFGSVALTAIHLATDKRTGLLEPELSNHGISNDAKKQAAVIIARETFKVLSLSVVLSAAPYSLAPLLTAYIADSLTNAYAITK